MDLLDLFVKVAYDDKDVGKGIEGTSKKGKGFAKTLGAAFKGTAAVVGAISTAAIAVGGAFVKGAMAVSDYGSEVNDMSQKLNMTAQGFQEWRYILGQSGVDIGVLQGGMKKLSESAVAGSESFAALGISQEQLATLSTEELFNTTIAQLSEMEAGNERTALAADLFGRSATELLPILNQGADSIEEMRKQAEDYGLVMSDEAVKASDDFGDSVALMQQALTGMKNRMIGEFLPSLTLVTDGLAKLFTGDMSGLDSINAGIGGFVDKIAQAMPQIIEVGGSIIQSLVSALMQNMPLLVTAAFDLISQFAGFVLENLPMLIETALAILTTLALGIAEQAPTLIPAIVQTVLTIMQTLIDNIPLLVDAALQLMMGLVQGILEAIPQIIAALPRLIQSIISFITSSIPMITNAAIQLFMSIIQAIPVIVQSLIGALPQIINSIIDGLLTALPLILEAAISLLMAIVEAIPTIISFLVSDVPTIVSTIINALLSRLPDLINGAISLFMGILQAIPQIIAQLVQQMPLIIGTIVKGLSDGLAQIIGVGANLVKGLWQGIKNMAGWLWNQVSSWAKGLLAQIQGLFGVHSPSTITEWMGEMLMKGLALGIGNTADEVFAAMKAVYAGMFGLGVGQTFNASVAAAIASGTGIVGENVSGGLYSIFGFLTEGIEGLSYLGGLDGLVTEPGDPKPPKPPVPPTQPQKPGAFEQLSDKLNRIMLQQRSQHRQDNILLLQDKMAGSTRNLNRSLSGTQLYSQVVAEVQ